MYVLMLSIFLEMRVRIPAPWHPHIDTDQVPFCLLGCDWCCTKTFSSSSNADVKGEGTSIVRRTMPCCGGRAAIVFSSESSKARKQLTVLGCDSGWHLLEHLIVWEWADIRNNIFRSLQEKLARVLKRRKQIESFHLFAHFLNNK